MVLFGLEGIGKLAMFNVQIATLNIHDIYTGFLFFKSDGIVDALKTRNKIMELSMMAMGFEDEKEYKKVYPGQYGFNSALAVKLELDTAGWTKGDLTLLSSIFASGLTDQPIDNVLRFCKDYTLGSIELGSEKPYSSMVLFPTIVNFNESVPMAYDPEYYKNCLWFCEDWYEKP